MAYDVQNYQLAAELFVDLVGGEVPRLQNRPLVVESRKFLAASYLFLGRDAEAVEALERLLQDEPDYLLDPLAFPEDVQKVFRRVKERLTKERIEAAAAEARMRERQRLHELEQRMARKERIERLMTLAETERVEEMRSRWVAMVPFGVGQFQNGHDGLGLLLGVTEAVLVGTSVTTFILHEDLRGTSPRPDLLDDAMDAEKNLRLINHISLTALAVLAVTGIIDAQLRFKASRSYDRKRQLPSDLRQGFEVGLSPTGVQLRSSF